MVGAVVLAAGAATRFGAPKQRLLLPAVLEHVRGLDQIVVVAGAYPLEGAIDCSEWQRGPGYTTVDPPPTDTQYTEGTVAMAKGAADAAGTSGSQFFVVTAPDAGLPPDYAVIGTVIDGMETVSAIEALGTGDGPPGKPVVIEKVTVRKS